MNNEKELKVLLIPKGRTKEEIEAEDKGITKILKEPSEVIKH